LAYSRDAVPGLRGGARIIYYWAAPRSNIFMLLAYAKNRRDDLTDMQLCMLRDLVEREFG
jgi:hypothetical protein